MNDRMNDITGVQLETDLVGLVHVVVKRKGLIIKICGAVAVISVVVALLLPNVYTATAKVLPPQKDGGGGLSALIGQAGGLAGLAGLATGMGMGGTGDLYIGILKSRSVADAVIARLDLKKVFETTTPDETRRVLESMVKIQAGKDGIIVIKTDSKDPKMAALLANTFVEELGRKSVQLNLTKAGTERSFLEKRLDIVKNDLKRAEESLRTFQERNKAIKVDTQASASIQGIAKLKAEIISKEVQLASLKSYQTDESQEVKGLQAAIGKLRSQLGGLAGNGSNDDGIPSMGNAPKLGLEYFRRMRELKTQEAIYEQLTKQNEIAKLNEAKDSSSLQVLDEAVPPEKKSKPKRAIIVILSTVTAFFIAIFAAFIAENAGKMPEDDKARWDEIKGMLFTRKVRR